MLATANTDVAAPPVFVNFSTKRRQLETKRVTGQVFLGRGGRSQKGFRVDGEARREVPPPPTVPPTTPPECHQSMQHAIVSKPALFSQAWQARRSCGARIIRTARDHLQHKTSSWHYNTFTSTTFFELERPIFPPSQPPSQDPPRQRPTTTISGTTTLNPPHAIGPRKGAGPVPRRNLRWSSGGL